MVNSKAQSEFDMTAGARQAYAIGNLVMLALCLTIGLTVFSDGGRANGAEIYSPKGIVELFTSQGCSSCPPADKFVTSTHNSTDILALAWHVDYWDYLGWKDTFARPEHADRQRRYSESFGENQIYTPQAVINGRVHTIGSQSAEILRILDSHSDNNNGLTVPINARVNGDILDISIDRLAHGDKANLWMVYFADHRQVKIERGENRGKLLTYSNVVRDIELIGMLEPVGFKTMLPLDEVSRKGHNSCVLIVQQTTRAGTPGAIIGAVVIRNLLD